LRQPCERPRNASNRRESCSHLPPKVNPLYPQGKRIAPSKSADPSTKKSRKKRRTEQRFFLIARLPSPPRPRGVGESGPPCLRENPDFHAVETQWIGGHAVCFQPSLRDGVVLLYRFPWTKVHGYPRTSLSDFDLRKPNPTSSPSRRPAQRKLLCVLRVLGEKTAVRTGVCVTFVSCDNRIEGFGCGSAALCPPW
jgi:hypothetical protein